MSNWKNVIDFSHFYKDEQLEIMLKARAAAEAIKKAFPMPNDELQDIIYEFHDLSKNGTGNFDEDVKSFDGAMEQLYDWGDAEIEPFGEWPRNAQCWIKTF